MKLTRRSLLEAGWKVGGGFLALIAGWTSWELLRPLKADGATGPIDAGSSGNFAKGTATYVGAGRFWIANPDGKRLLALSQKCPHLGCRVPFCESSGRFECPCHGSVFDIGGEYIAGPSPRGMDQFHVDIDASGKVIVDTSKRTDGPAHGANAFYSDPKGPSCKEA
jgi:Rieske Fe-S protein